MADGCPADKNKAKGKAETEHQIWMGIAPTMIPDRQWAEHDSGTAETWDEMTQKRDRRPYETTRGTERGVWTRRVDMTSAAEERQSPFRCDERRCPSDPAGWPGLGGGGGRGGGGGEGVRCGPIRSSPRIEIEVAATRPLAAWVVAPSPRSQAPQEPAPEQMAGVRAGIPKGGVAEGGHGARARRGGAAACAKGHQPLSSCCRGQTVEWVCSMQCVPGNVSHRAPAPPVPCRHIIDELPRSLFSRLLVLRLQQHPGGGRLAGVTGAPPLISRSAVAPQGRHTNVVAAL
ncbi:hypothetical protein PCL_02430 [Purpureocillium lilacinum]|uniref:Uncharacterized protein n=1 Tax=Purpureocillium lilacinum TaxID=33203 RepID=A0A2U3E0J0_PURLI|nr:hypothetical protein Purlil1_11214 [Purpureocillium lilacinum]PWI68029.1 hypothetical protein PCL_02430 [Purpureocillium lilacinum]